MKTKRVKPEVTKWSPKGVEVQNKVKRGKAKKVELNDSIVTKNGTWIVEDDTDDILSPPPSENNGRPSGEVTKKRKLSIADYDGELEDALADDELNTDSAGNPELIESILEIVTSKTRQTKRKEAAPKPEEFVAVKGPSTFGDEGVNKFLESVKETGDSKTVEKISKLVAVAENSRSSKHKPIKTLDAPAERIQSEKVKRNVLYENTKEEVSKWNSVVYHNRVAEQVVYPLSGDNKAFKKPKRNNSAEFMPTTPLEEEIAKVLYGEDYVQRKKAEMAKDPEQTDMESYLLSVEEAMVTHSEMAKLRALQSYAMAKAKRQNKIKSKTYHRLLRKSKIKQQMQEFEELQKTDPEAAMLKLEELEKSRVQERMSLKHRNTTKWAKMQAARAKYNKDSRIALSEQLKMSRDLTQKVEESSDDEEEDNIEIPGLVKSCVENPWMLKPALQESERLQMYYTGYKKFWNEYNEQMERRTEDTDPHSISGNGESSLSRKGKSVLNGPRAKDGDANEIRDLVVNDNIILEDTSEEFNDESWTEDHSKTASKNKGDLRKSEVEKTTEVNPDNFLKITKAGASIAPQFNAENSKALELLDDDESSDEETDQRNLIAEAFEDDEVVDEFIREKKEITDAENPKDIDNFLPGWGSWTGKDIAPNPKKRKRFIKKAKKGPPRKDARASHVIINEDADSKVRQHQVKNLPFPFTRVKDFEKSVRAPIGSTWMPERTVKTLTAPKVITRLGATIKPISEEVLVKPKESKFHVPNTIIRMANVVVKK